MLLEDVPDGFWTDPGYNMTTVTWGSAIHISDALEVPLCGDPEPVTSIAGAEHDGDDLCTACAQLVTDWIG